MEWDGMGEPMIFLHNCKFSGISDPAFKIMVSLK
jgi:hypothetical protein